MKQRGNNSVTFSRLFQGGLKPLVHHGVDERVDLLDSVNASRDHLLTAPLSPPDFLRQTDGAAEENLTRHPGQSSPAGPAVNYLETQVGEQVQQEAQTETNSAPDEPDLFLEVHVVGVR